MKQLRQITLSGSVITLSDSLKPLLVSGLKHEINLLNIKKAELEQALDEIEGKVSPAPKMETTETAIAKVVPASTKMVPIIRTYKKSGKSVETSRKKPRRVVRGMFKRIVEILAKAEKPLSTAEIAETLKAENRKDYFKVAKSKIASSVASTMIENMKGDKKYFERVQEDGRYVYANTKS